MLHVRRFGDNERAHTTKSLISQTEGLAWGIQPTQRTNNGAIL